MSTSTTVDQFVITTLESFGAENATAESSLATLGIDSLDMAEFAQVVDEELGVKLEGKDLKAIETVGDVIELVRSRQA